MQPAKTQTLPDWDGGLPRHIDPQKFRHSRNRVTKCWRAVGVSFPFYLEHGATSHTQQSPPLRAWRTGTLADLGRTRGHYRIHGIFIVPFLFAGTPALRSSGATLEALCGLLSLVFAFACLIDYLKPGMTMRLPRPRTAKRPWFPCAHVRPGDKSENI